MAGCQYGWRGRGVLEKVPEKAYLSSGQHPKDSRDEKGEVWTLNLVVTVLTSFRGWGFWERKYIISLNR